MYNLFKVVKVLVLFLSVLSTCKSQLTQYTSNINMDGLEVAVTLSQNGSAPMEISFTGLTTGSDYTWQFHTFPMMYDTAVKCGDKNIGPRLGMAGGDAVNGQVNGFDISSLTEITGGTLLLKKKSDQSKYCALIRSSTESTSAIATLVATIGGSITFREFCDDTAGDTCTTIYSNLFFLDGTKTAGQYDWKIYNGQSEEDGSQARCSKLTTVVKSFTARMDVGANSGESKWLFTESPGMPVSGSGSILDKSVAIMAADGESILTCATIVQIKPKSVLVTFNRDGVKGSITFDQNSPYDPTEVHTQLNNLTYLAQSYHVHEFPVPQRWLKEDSLCSAVAVGGHYNPYGVTNAAPPGTDDQFEIGDLSSKYSGLTGLDTINLQYTDDNLPLFGTHSVVGRSVVIHYDDATGSRWICENINYGTETDTIIGNFKFPVIGSIMLRQPKNEPHADTSLFIQLAYSDVRPVSSGHAWHVHKDPTGDDFDAPLGQRCISELGTYNPYKVITSGASNYYSECKAGNTLRCKLGDLAGRHGNLTIGTDAGGYFKLFLTDIHMPLSGPMTILGRSIDVHAPNYDRLSCTTLRRVVPAVAKVGTWTPGGATGSITVKQETLYDQTQIDVNLAGLQAAGGYHVHEYPIIEGSNQPCSDGSTGGHLNPFEVNATAGPAPGQGTQDEYEIGDLSGKFGRLTGMTTAVVTYTDNNFPLRGLFSSVGRSIVIHKEIGNVRWVCGNIDEDTGVTGGRIHRAKVVFTTGVIRGEIQMSQYEYDDGSSSDTSVLVDLRYPDASQMTDNHNWHTHEKLVGSDAAAETKPCASTGPHYNPYQVDVNNGYVCSTSNPWRCELGDQSGKLGKYNIGRGRTFYKDVDLPLFGKFSVMGRSVVVHEANAGADRMACADIIPDTTVIAIIAVPVSVGVIDKNDLASAIALGLNASPWNIVVGSIETPLSGCHQVTVYILGDNAQELKIKIENLNLDMGKYGTGSTCSSSGNAVAWSIILLAAGLISRML